MQILYRNLKKKFKPDLSSDFKKHNVVRKYGLGEAVVVVGPLFLAGSVVGYKREGGNQKSAVLLFSR